MKSFTATDALTDFTANEILERETLDQTGLKKQFEQILAEHGPALSRLAASYTNTRSDRDDLLQETAFAIWQALPKFRGECSERTFVFRIAHNRAIAYLSRYRNEKVEALEGFDVHDPAAGPDSNYSQRQRVDNLRKAVRGLPLPYRQVILLTLEGLGYRDIAAVLGISEGNVGARLTRARQLLQDAMEKRK